MRGVACLLIIASLAGCAANSDLPRESSYSRHQQVQHDVDAIQQGMNYARSQAEAVARARARAQ